jgi:hypothetical protein
MAIVVARIPKREDTMKFLGARYSTILPVIILATGASVAYGSVLTPPQGPVAPDSWTSCTGCTPVGSGIFGAGSTSASLGFVYSEGVFTNDPLNPYGLSGLDFVYSFLNNATSTSVISSIAAGNFGNVSTDVGYFTSAAFPGGTVAPNTVSRTSASTAVFGFNGFAPGDESLVLVIKTNASSFGPGTLTVVDSSGSSGTVAGLAPVPEPNLVWPAGALLVIAAYRRARVSKA